MAPVSKRRMPLPRASVGGMTLEKHTVHKGLQMTSGTLTHDDAFFQKAYTCASVGGTSSDYNSRPEVLIFTLSFSLFIRHY